MRPYFLLVLALTLLFVCSNEAVAVETQSLTSVFNVGLTQRLLRTEGALADEERALGVGRLTTWFRFWRLRRVADKIKTTDAISAKESKWIDGWVKRDFSPGYVFTRLGLAKRGEKAMESQNYRLFESFTERMFAKDQALYTTWLSAKMTPEDVFKTLKLDKMKPAKAAKTEDFRRYEVYLYKWYDGK